MLPLGSGGAPSLWSCPYWHSQASIPSTWHALTTTPPSPLTWHLGESACPVGEAGGTRRGYWGCLWWPCSRMSQHPHHLHLSHT